MQRIFFGLRGVLGLNGSNEEGSFFGRKIRNSKFEIWNDGPGLCGRGVSLVPCREGGLRVKSPFLGVEVVVGERIEACQCGVWGAYGGDVFQVIFNEISAAEMAALPKELQLELLSEFHFLPGDLGGLDREHFGTVSRDGRVLHRYRAKDYRIYFEKHSAGLLIHRVLHKNTIRDFLFRSNLPLDEEDTGLSRTTDFWKLIHEAEAAKK